MSSIQGHGCFCCFHFTQSKLCYWKAKAKQDLIIGWRWLSLTLLARQHRPAGLAHAALSPPNLISPCCFVLCSWKIKKYDSDFALRLLVSPVIICKKSLTLGRLHVDRRIHFGDHPSEPTFHFEIAVYRWVPHLGMLIPAEPNADLKQWCNDNETEAASSRSTSVRLIPSLRAIPGEMTSCRYLYKQHGNLPVITNICFMTTWLVRFRSNSCLNVHLSSKNGPISTLANMQTFFGSLFQRPP